MEQHGDEHIIEALEKQSREDYLEQCADDWKYNFEFDEQQCADDWEYNEETTQ